VARVAGLSGFGYWSGRDVHVEFRPAPAGAGITFVRRDLRPVVRIPATVDQRVEAPRRTVLACGGARVEMVEHVLAALLALQVDNCEVWVDAPEMPGCDGSSQPFVDAILRAGTQPQAVPRRQLVVREMARVVDGDTWIEARPARGHELSVEYRLDYGANHAIGRQTYRAEVTPYRFRAELASARTFIMQSEAAWLRQRGLGLRTTYQDLLVFDDLQGPIDNPLRYPDECARHKVLDVIGDLALAGCDLVGRFLACRSGHRLNALLVQALQTEGCLRYWEKAPA
jgi:UDP-3-O-acyl N-acetylglucosamine deacetylase